MHFKEHAPRLTFLKDSASSLSSASPSTTAYLMSVHNSIFHEELKPLNQRLHDNFCGACGSPRNKEWTKTASIRKKSQKQASSTATPNGATIYKCLRCRRRTVTPTRTPSRVPPSVTVPIVDSQSPTTNTTTTLSSHGSASKTTDNASSKKRAKARKQGGLQALLAAKQSRTESTQSLDLFDFLQQ
jgi:ribonuclease MRP protein subunit SNM1